jgi:hypothetical protein
MEYTRKHVRNIILGLLLVISKGINSQIIHNTFHIQKKGLSNNNILGICQDKKGLMWIENSKGLVLYDGYQSQIKNQENYSPLSEQKGIIPCQITLLNTPRIKRSSLHSNATPIGRFEKDGDKMSFKDHNLNDWILSSKHFLKNGKPINTKNIEGFLQQHKDELWFNTHFQSIDGVIWIGTNKGLLKIIEDNYKSKDSLSIYLTNTQYYDSKEGEWEPVTSNRHLETGLVEITLENDSPLRLNFALANYHSPRTNVFEYRLKEQHEEWIANDTNNYIICGNIGSGKHELEIRGKHVNGAWFSSSIPLLILAPVSQHLYILGFFIIGGIILLLYFFYQSRTLSHFSLLSFKRNISRDINNRIEDDIARMGIEIELLRNNICPKDEEKLMMKNISNSSRNIISTIGDVLWMIDHRRDTMEHLLDRIKEQANETLGYHGIETSFSAHVSSEKQSMPFAFKQSFFFFCKEAMSSIAMNPKIDHVHIVIHEKPLQFELSFILDKTMAFGIICQEAMKKESQKIKGKLFFQQKGIQLIIPNSKGLNIKSFTQSYFMNYQLR